MITLVAFLLASNAMSARQILSVEDFGLLPNTRENAVPYVKKAIEACREVENAVLFFPEGRYDFWPDGCERVQFLPKFARVKEPNAPIGIFIDNMDNLTIDGNGSEFIYHGNMMSIGVQNSRNTILKNFTIDWDRPFISQATVEAVTDKYIDIRVDACEYPYVIEDEVLYFTGEGWKSQAAHHCLFDKDRMEIVYRTRDFALGEMGDFKAIEHEPGKIRLSGDIIYKPEIGTYIAFYNVRQYYLGIGLKRNQNTTIEDITIHHAPGVGVYTFFCDGVTLRRTNISVNEAKGRVFSTLADATYFVNNKGLLTIEDCHHTGQTDDWANFRGTYTLVEKITGKNAVYSKHKRDSADEYYYAGDVVSLVDTSKMQRRGSRVVESVTLLESGNTEIVFTEPLPDYLEEGFALENMTWTPEVVVRNCTIPKRNRARGILISTPKKSIIENNYFRTAGTAILVEGDLDVWFEAGSIGDLVIRNNVFENCLTSGSSGGTQWEWGEAVITITPSHKPGSADEKPYHQNIIIENNTINTFDVPLVRARSVENLQFINNEINRTYDYEPFAWQKTSFLLDGCRDVMIGGNTISEQYGVLSIKTDHMKKSDVTILEDPFIDHL